MSTELTITQRAVTALGYDNEKQLLELAAKSKDLVEVTNGDSYKQIHAARMALKNSRIEIEKRGKEARDEATKFSKAVIQEEKRLIGLIKPEEDRLQAIQTAHDEAEERARQEKIEAEEHRVESHQIRIAEIRGAVEACTRFDSSAELIAEHIADIESVSIDDSFEEFRQAAQDAKTATLARLQDAHRNAVAREEERRKAAEAQAELAKLKAEQAAREAKELAERQERERKEREKRESEEKAAREKLAAEQAEIARQQKIENDRLAAERARIAEEERKAREAREAEERAALEKIAAENKRLADERAAFEREQAEAKRKADEAERARLAVEAAERKRREDAERLAKKSKYPGEAAIVEVLTEHFGVTESVVRSWLMELRKAA